MIQSHSRSRRNMLTRSALWSVSLMFAFHLASQTPASIAQDAAAPIEEVKLPWDYDPYKVMIWVAGVDSDTLDSEWKTPLLSYLDRDFKSLWRTEIVQAPAGLAAVAKRNFAGTEYGVLTADDPVMVMKRDHPNAARIRLPSDVTANIKEILVEQSHADSVVKRAIEAGNPELHGMIPKFTPVPGDLFQLQKRWSEKETEVMLLPRGMALSLKPQPKLIELDVSGRMGELFSNYDKIFLVLVEQETMNTKLSVREFDCLMRLPGPVMTQTVVDSTTLPTTVGRMVTDAFAPVIRLDDVGDKVTEGRIRAGGLIMDPASPAAFNKGDWVQPVMRKNERTGEPQMVGIIDWTYLIITEQEEARVKLEMHSGRAGALKGQRNSRTIRAALKIRPVFENTTLRLHAKGNSQQPLVGYDVYEKSISAGTYDFVGQTDWDGRLLIEKTASPLRLLYVKNGGAVLARLPVVPGQSKLEVADLVGDDIRLQAEAYIRGVQNAIIDLVAIRTLFASSIRSNIKKGNFAKALEQLDKLRKEPSYEKLANDMALKQNTITSRNRSEQAKIQNMFAETRTLLVKHINPTIVRELESELTAAGGSTTTAAPIPNASAAPSDAAR